MTQKLTCPLLYWTTFLIVLSAWAHGSVAQVKKDPCKGFLGVWTGTIVVNHEHLPNDVSLRISEWAGGKGMLWDYTFGRPGQKGFDRASKVVALFPARSTMRTHWWGHRELTLETSGLDEFASKGLGTFSACVTPSKHNFWIRKTDASNCVTYRVEPSKFTYVWKTTRDGITSTWSQFEFTRVGDPSAPTPATVNKK